MNYRDKLEKICNFQEITMSIPPRLQQNYIEFETVNDSLIRERKRLNRSLVIDKILDEVDDDENYYLPDSSLDEESYTTISPKIKTITLSSSPFIDDETLYKSVINFLDSNTRKKYNSSMVLDYVVTSDPNYMMKDNDHINYRRIVTKIMHASNLITMEGRIGPATTIIVGKNNWSWFESNSDPNFLSNMGILYDEIIDPNKIIVLCNGKVNQPGVLCTVCTPDNTFYLKETDNWDKQYVWFTVK